MILCNFSMSVASHLFSQQKNSVALISVLLEDTQDTHTNTARTPNLSTDASLS